jgi:hypothetical protein
MHRDVRSMKAGKKVAAELDRVSARFIVCERSRTAKEAPTPLPVNRG